VLGIGNGVEAGARFDTINHEARAVLREDIVSISRIKYDLLKALSKEPTTPRSAVNEKTYVPKFKSIGCTEYTQFPQEQHKPRLT
jgi:hypothetical protein